MLSQAHAHVHRRLKFLTSPCSRTIQQVRKTGAVSPMSWSIRVWRTRYVTSPSFLELPVTEVQDSQPSQDTSRLEEKAQAPNLGEPEPPADSAGKEVLRS